MMRKLSFQTSSSSINSISSSSTTPTISSFAPLNLPASLSDPSLPFPKLIVFDLDYTLWPFWVDTHATPPFKFNAQHTSATDRTGEDFAFYSDVPSILQLLPALPSSHRIKLGVASRTSAPSLARDLLKGLHLPPSPYPSFSSSSSGSSGSSSSKRHASIDVFDGGMEIYPGSKIKHFEQLCKRNGGVRYEDMLFFDDEARNRETETLGVTMRLVRDGVTWEEIGKGVEEWRRRRKIQA